MNKSVRKPPLKEAEFVIKVMCRVHNGVYCGSQENRAEAIILEYAEWWRYIAGLIQSGALYSDEFPPRTTDDERVDIAARSLEVRSRWTPEDYHKRRHHYALGDSLKTIDAEELADMNAYLIPTDIDSGRLLGGWKKQSEEDQRCDNDYWGINYEYNP